MVQMQSSESKIYSNSGNQEVMALIEVGLKNILDIGCGSGTLGKILMEKGHTVDGITISEIEYASASTFLRNVYIYNLENGLPETLKQNHYDCIVCSHVLEHIAYPEKLLGDIFSILNPNGKLIVALPNLLHYKTRFQLLMGNFNYTDMGIWDYTHLRWYTFQSAKKMLEKNGFIVEYAGVSGKLPFYSIVNRFMGASLHNSIYKMLTKISRGFFGYQLLFKAVKREKF